MNAAQLRAAHAKGLRPTAPRADLRDVNRFVYRAGWPSTGTQGGDGYAHPGWRWLREGGAAVRIGELFAGYGGLGMGVKAVLGGDVAWVSEIDKGACKVLAHRFPDAPNHGDIIAIDWAQVEPVEVICAGFPCQPVSNAGKQLGDQDERWLWDEVLRAVRALRPGLVVLENVRGLLTNADGRLFGQVVGSLAGIGYDATWVCLPASRVGACHKRTRVFIAAHPFDANPTDLRYQWGGTARDWWDGPKDSGGRALLPTPRATDGTHGGPNQRATPRATDGTHGGPNQRGSKGDLMLPSAVAKLLPTPVVTDASGTRNATAGRSPDAKPFSLGTYADRFADYAAAIARQEAAFGHPAPDPTEPAPKGGRRLSCRFDEWMMGLPPGWITDVPGITHSETLRLCGNGVVWQQAAEAIRWCLPPAEAQGG